MNKTRALIVTSAALLSLVLARQSAGQAPTPTPRQRLDPSTDTGVINPRTLNLVDWVRGEAPLGGGSLTCVLAGGNSGYSYRTTVREAVILKFSFGRAPSRSATPVGSWAVRRVPTGSTFARSPIIFAGDFTGGQVSLTAHLPGGRPAPRLFNLVGQITASDGRCFNQDPPKKVTIQGNCDRPLDGINLQILAGERVYARGTFSGDVNVNVLCASGPASGIDGTLNRPPPP